MSLPFNEPLKMPAAGTVIELPREVVYLANDNLRLRLTKVGSGHPVHPNQEWVTVEGYTLGNDDTAQDYSIVLVPVRALRELVKQDEDAS